MRTADLLSHFPGRGPGALAALLLAALAFQAARLPVQPARPPAVPDGRNDVLVTVQENNTPASIDDLLNGTAFRGAGQELRIEGVPGTQLQRYGISFRDR